jgi:hypothetical protein
LSFFDDEGDEPRTTAGRPRSPMGGAGPLGGGLADRQTLMVRRGVALAVAVVLLILIVLGIGSCLSAHKHDALVSYNSDVTTLAHESQDQVSRPLFAALGRARSRSPQDLQTTLSELHITAQEQAQHARSISVPSEMNAPQRYLLLTLDFRAEAIDKIARNILTAFVPRTAEASDAVSRIAGETQVFLASDVVYSQRVAPLIAQVLQDNGIKSQTVASSQFLPDLGWLDPNTVRSRLGAPGSAAATGPVAPGLHGHALDGVSIGNNTLASPPAVNHPTGAANPTFTVKLTNGGSNDETNVKVDITVTGGGKTLTATKTIDKTTAGQSTSVDIPLGQPVPTRVPLKVTAFVEPVPGEKNVANNKGTFTVIFSR